jgi:hypothetical protein
MIGMAGQTSSGSAAYTVYRRPYGLGTGSNLAATSIGAIRYTPNGMPKKPEIAPRKLLARILANGPNSVA